MKTIFAVVVVLVCVASVNGSGIVAFPIFTDSQDKYFPAVSGDFVGWRNESAGGIYVRDIFLGRNYRVGNAPSNIGMGSASEVGPNMGGDWMVWDENGQVHFRNLITGTHSVLGQLPGIYRTTIKTDGAKMVWQDHGRLEGRNVTAGNVFTIVPNGHQWRPDIDGDVVVWQDDRIDGSTMDDIMGYRFSTGQEFPIHLGPGGQGRPGVSGNFVVWQEDYKGIYGYDLSTSTEFAIASTSLPGGREFPAISGNTVVWMDSRNGDYDIYGYNLLTREEFPVYVGPGDQMWPAIDGGSIVWSDSRNGHYDIYGATIPEPVSLALLCFSALVLVHRRHD